MDVSGGASAGNDDTSASKQKARGEKHGAPPDEVTAVSLSSLTANQRAVLQMRRPAESITLTPGEPSHVPMPSGTAPRKKKPKQPMAHPEGATLAAAESPVLPASSTSTDSVAAVGELKTFRKFLKQKFSTPGEAFDQFVGPYNTQLDKRTFLTRLEELQYVGNSERLFQALSGGGVEIVEREVFKQRLVAPTSSRAISDRVEQPKNRRISFGEVVPAESNHSGAAEVFAPAMGASGQSAPISMPQPQKSPQGKDKHKGKGKSKGKSQKATPASAAPPGNFFPGTPMASVAGGDRVHAGAPMLFGPAAAAAHQQAVVHAMHGHLAFAQHQAAQQHQAAHVKATILHRAMQTALMQTAYMRQPGMARPAYPAPPWEASPELPPHIAAMIAAHGQNGDGHGPQERVSANRGGYNLRPSPAYTADPNHGQESTAASSSNRAAVRTGDGQPIYSGVLKTFSPKDGYGFIHCPTLSEGFDRDIYIHQAQVPEGASCGCTLSFCLYLNNRGQPQAREVSYVIGDDTEAGGMRGELLLDLSFEKLQQDNQGGCGRSTRTVRVASWNILAAAYATCKAFPDVQPGFLAWPRRRPMIASALATMDADVVCLQEVDRPFGDLGLEDYDHVRAQRPDARADGCIIAWKRSRFSLNRKEVISFDDYIPVNAERKERAQRFRRGNCAVIVELCSEGERPFAVATAHLCWEAEFEDVRQVQACVLLEAMEPHSKRLGQRTVLCGDLNAMPGCASHGIVTTLMSSVYADLEVAEGAVTNSNASASIPVVIGAEGSRKLSEERQFEESKRCGFAGMLDYICVDNRAATAVSRLRLPGREELRAKLGDAHGLGGPMPTLLCTNWPSDHLPVAADISFGISFQ